MTAGRLAVVLSALLLGASFVAFSGASFNDITSNPSGATAADLTLSSTRDGATLLSSAGLEPGESSPLSTVDIKNAGDVADEFELFPAARADTPATPGWSTKVRIKVEDLGPVAAPLGTPVSLYDGTLAAMGRVALGTFAPGAERRYRFRATFPQTTVAADAAFEGASTAFRFTWAAET